MIATRKYIDILLHKNYNNIYNINTNNYLYLYLRNISGLVVIITVIIDMFLSL